MIDKEVVEKVRYILDSQIRIDLGESDLYIQYFKLEGVIDCYYEVGRQLTIYLSDQVWDRIAPGLASQFDSPYSIPAIAPRPLLILNGKIPFHTGATNHKHSDASPICPSPCPNPNTEHYFLKST